VTYISAAVPPIAISTLGIILLAIAAIIALLAVGGYIAAARRAKAQERELLRHIQEAERALAQAKASDKGWDRETMEAAARQAIEERFPGSDIEAMQLVQVVDRPGTDADQAVFRVETSDGEHRVTLGRTDGVWGAAKSDSPSGP
jgi:Tfp pilus assembly protein PilE